jgi:S-DNA-T family DNA segregation ATPase FtsK/SpoIIIE
VTTASLLGGACVIHSLGLSSAEWRGLGQGMSALVRTLAERAGRTAEVASPLLATAAGPPSEPVFPPGRRDQSRRTASSTPPAARSSEPLVAPRAARHQPSRREEEARQGRLDLPESDNGYALPPLHLLTPPPDSRGITVNEESLQQNARLLESVLDDFGVNGEIVKIRPGPVVTLYELEPAPGTKTSRVIGLADDIARSMSALSVRIATVPGRSVIGIELPNQRRETVFLRELLAADAYDRAPARLTLVLGKDIGGQPTLVDLARMPHLLIAGTTGSGKSVAINTMILSLLFRLKPEECRLIMIDPKMLELSVYDGIPHLLAPVVTEPGKAVVALKWAVREMEDRYRAMSQLGVRNISGYNQRLAEARQKGESLSRTVQTGFDGDTGKPVYEEQPLALEPLPFIVVVVDEMADLMLVAGKDIEAAVQRLAQMARAAGIHLIMATQRPSVDVITGTIKANFPSRISFQVSSKIDSRTILGEQGAEQLLGQGDMLYMAAGGRITRVHGPFVSDQEVESVVEHLRAQGEPRYEDSVTEEMGASGADSPGAVSGEAGQELYDQAVALVAREGKASTSFIQRHLQIGYNRAARIIEQMEAEGVIGRANHVGKREVLVRGHGE